MAVEKTLNARLKLKIDSYENWIANDPILLDGEVAFTTISVKQEGTANYVPSVLMKVGQNGKKYSELDFVYAKTADVISACKSEATLTTFINNVIASSGIATDEALSVLAGRMSTAESDIDALETLVGSVAVSTQITAEIQKLDKADTAVAGQYVSAVSETDGIITVTRKSLPDYTDVYAAKSHTHAIADVTGLQTELNKVTTLIGTDAGKSARTIANEELAAQLIPENAKASLDTLQEIATWIQNHPDDASAMNTRIGNLETKVGATSVSAQITAAIEALKIGDYAKAADLTAAVARITTLETKSHTHTNKALLDTYTQTEANLADAVAKKHTHANATELAKFADGDKAKLDTAVQSITASTGLTATKTGTDVAIGIDDTVTFIFDCGSSSVNV